VNFANNTGIELPSRSSCYQPCIAGSAKSTLLDVTWNILVMSLLDYTVLCRHRYCHSLPDRNG